MFVRENEHRYEDLNYYEDGFYQVSDLFYGLLSTVKFRSSIGYVPDLNEDHPINDKYLDIFTLAWGGDISLSRMEKLRFIADQQNEMLMQYEEIYLPEKEYKRFYIK